MHVALQCRHRLVPVGHERQLTRPAQVSRVGLDLGRVPLARGMDEASNPVAMRLLGAAAEMLDADPGRGPHHTGGAAPSNPPFRPPNWKQQR